MGNFRWRFYQGFPASIRSGREKRLGSPGVSCWNVEKTTGFKPTWLTINYWSLFMFNLFHRVLWKWTKGKKALAKQLEFRAKFKWQALWLRIRIWWKPKSRSIRNRFLESNWSMQTMAWRFDTNLEDFTPNKRTDAKSSPVQAFNQFFVCVCVRSHESGAS